MSAGARYISQVSDVEVIIVRTHPEADAESLRCGGLPMLALPAGRDRQLQPRPASDEGSAAIGQRLTHPDDPRVEVLVTKGGPGRPLPASD